jgi:hypothetical protein
VPSEVGFRGRCQAMPTRLDSSPGSVQALSPRENPSGAAAAQPSPAATSPSPVRSPIERFARDGTRTAPIESARDHPSLRCAFGTSRTGREATRQGTDVLACSSLDVALATHQLVSAPGAALATGLPRLARRWQQGWSRMQQPASHRSVRYSGRRCVDPRRGLSPPGPCSTGSGRGPCECRPS